MGVVIATAKHEAGGWRGEIIDAQGKLLARTINLYPDSDKAIAGVQRLCVFQQQRAAQPAPGGAA